jgi:hypothetical protein
VFTFVFFWLVYPVGSLLLCEVAVAYSLVVESGGVRIVLEDKLCLCSSGKVVVGSHAA